MTVSFSSPHHRTDPTSAYFDRKWPGVDKMSCPECGIVAANSRVLAVHRLRQHAPDDEREAARMANECNVCHEAFVAAGDLK